MLLRALLTPYRQVNDMIDSESHAIWLCTSLTCSDQPMHQLHQSRPSWTLT